MQRFLMPLFLWTAALAVPLAAHADTIDTFVLTGTYAYPGNPTLTRDAGGTITIDTTTGTVLSANLTFPGSDLLGVSDWQAFPASASFPVTTVLQEWFSSSSGRGLAISIPGDLVGYAGGPICSQAAPCVFGVESLYFDIADSPFVNGTLSPAPEPSSLALLGTGALGVLGLLRRKLI